MVHELNNTDSNSTHSRFRSLDYIKITVFAFALAALSSGLHSIILPLRVVDFVSGAEKNTYLGLLTFAGLIIAMLMQPIAGAISDRSTFRWGRRRPYILIGTIAVIVLLGGIGLSSGYVAVFIFWCLLQASANTAQGPFQAFIPDLAPEGKRGLASGVKGLLEIIGGIALVRVVGIFMGRRYGGEGDFWLWMALGILAAILLAAMLATVLSVRERPLITGSQPSIWSILNRTFQIKVRENPAFVYFLVSRLLFIMALTTIQAFALYFLQDVAGLENPVTATADLLIIVGICMIATVYPAGRLSDRTGRKPILVASGIIGAVGIAGIYFSPSYIYIIFSGCFVGIAAGAFLSTNWALATDLVPEGEEARYLGLTNLATAGGAALARLIGPVIDYFNTMSSGLGYSVMLLACFLYFIIGSALIMKIRISN